MTIGGDSTHSRDEVSRLAGSLALDEKALLTAGEDLWSLPAIERVGIGKLLVTDGPNGARGPCLPGQESSPTTCVPCGSALGATWDPQVLYEVGQVLAEEARSQGCRMLLAPTVNIPRSPLAGRNFECYSEDPLLSGLLAAAFVRGVQDNGVVATVKHFVANDAETERMTASSVVSERALRELYLVPFELAVRKGAVLAVMTGYNRVNGTWCSEHAELLAVLREDWGFDGLVVTDWYAVASTETSSTAGLDVEMPGPGRAYGRALAEAVREGRVDEATLQAQATRIVSVLDRVGLVSRGEANSDATSLPPRPPADRRSSVARRAAVGSLVLLKNEGLLPLRSQLRKVAVIGELGGGLTLMGGGSAAVSPDPTTGLLDALRDRMGGGVEIVFQPGVRLARATPVLEVPMRLDLFGSDPPGDDPVQHHDRPSAETMYVGPPASGLEGPFSIRATGLFTPSTDGTHTFTLSEVGKARLYLEGELLLDGFEGSRKRGEGFMGLGLEEIAADVDLVAGRPVEVEVDYRGDGNRQLSAFRVGCRPPEVGDLTTMALEAARSADAVVIVVGTTNEWESEGFDRGSLRMPAGQDELVAKVLECNPHTVVVVNAGAPVDIGCATGAEAAIYGWFGGQEMAGALADVLTGAADPAGRLPLTLPTSIGSTPAYGNFPGEGGSIVYGEGLLVGYRWYQSRGIGVRYPFGHGLSYSTFGLGPPRLSSSHWSDGDELEVTIVVSNTGARAGAEVVQCYVEPPLSSRAFRPDRELKAFSKVWLDPGQSGEVSLRLDGRSFAHWDLGTSATDELRARLPFPQLAGSSGAREAGWRVEPGTYTLHVGRSSVEIAWRIPVEVDGAFWRN